MFGKEKETKNEKSNEPNVGAKKPVEQAALKPETAPAAAGTELKPESKEAPKADAHAPAQKPPEENPAVKELAAMKDRYVHLLADFDNFRKRQVREREEWIQRANESLLKDLLPVVDHLELAIGKIKPEERDAFTEGIELVYKQFLGILEKHDVTPVDAEGEPFNADWHEALSQMPSETVPENTVIQQYRRGWALGGKLLRAAQVIVSSGKPPKPEAKKPEEKKA